jgi:hypothetical protein
MSVEPVGKLKTVTLGDLTQTQLNATTVSTFVNRPTALKQATEIHQAKLAISTFGGNGIIPDSGAILATAFTDAPPTGSTIRPGEGEVWRVDLTDIEIVNGSSGTNTVKLMLTDGAVVLNIISTGIGGAATNGKLFDLEKTPSKVEYLTRSLYLAVVGTASDESFCNMPYTKVAI